MNKKIQKYVDFPLLMPLLTTLSLSKNPQVHFLMKKEGRFRFIFARCHRTLRWSIPKRDPRRFHSLAKRIRIMCISANKSEKVIYVRICEWWTSVNWSMCCYWKIDSWEKKMYKPLHLYVFELPDWIVIVVCDLSEWSLRNSWMGTQYTITIEENYQLLFEIWIPRTDSDYSGCIWIL